MADRSPAPADETTGTVQEMRPAEKFRLYMAQRAEAESTQNAEDVSASQVDKVFAATTAADIFGAVSAGTIQARDAVGMEIEIHSMRMQTSDRFEGAPYYANLDTTVLGGPGAVLVRNGVKVGDSALIQTGAEIIIAMVRAFEHNTLLPQKCVITGTETASGFEVLKLGPMPERTTPAETA